MLQRTRFVTSSTLSQYAGPLALYDVLYSYYLNNELYTEISTLIKNNGQWTEGIRPYRNPASRSVEFFTSKLWAGPLDSGLPLVAENKAILDPIKQIWLWSSWAAKKQLAARFFSLFGDLFIKVAYNEPDKTRVFFQVLDPRWVSDFDTDERGVITFIRVDIPQEAIVKGIRRQTWHTEYWEPDRMRIWNHQYGPDVSIDRLGAAKDDIANGLGFIPIVHAPFRDIGETRGMGCFVHVLDKIDEANRMVTRLHQMLFRNNKTIWALEAGGSSSDPRPLPAPRLGANTASEIEMGDDVVVSVPGSGTLKLLVPDIKYDSALAILNAQMDEIEQDLPELKYYRLDKQAGSSGVALRYMLGDAIDRVIEARGNAYAALIRANQIALTMAQRAGLEGFSEDVIGTYEQGDLDHTIGDVPVIALSPKDHAETLKLLTDAGVPLMIAMKRCGFSEAEIAEQIAHDREQQARIDQQRRDALAAHQQNVTPHAVGDQGTSNVGTGVIPSGLFLSGR